MSSDWGVSADEVCEIITGNGSSGSATFLHSLLSSRLDVDKLDYLIRDSVHCGVQYGEGIDAERLFESLFIDIDRKRLCVNQKGRSLPQTIISSRNLMFQEVYWHKTVRSCDSMFKRLIYELASGATDQEAVLLVAALERSDSEFLAQLDSLVGEGSSLRKLINPFLFENRRIYKLAFLSTRTTRLGDGSRRFFAKVLDPNVRYGTLVEMSRELAKSLGLSATDILVDKAPIKKGLNTEDELDALRYYNVRTNSWEDIDDATVQLDNFLSQNQQAYVYCEPTSYERLMSFSRSDWDSRLQKIAGKF